MWKHVLNLAVVCEILWTGYRAVGAEVTTIIGSLVLGPAEYFALAGTGIVALGMINWHLVHRIRARARKQLVRRENEDYQAARSVMVAIHDRLSLTGAARSGNPMERIARLQILDEEFAKLGLAPPQIVTDETQIHMHYSRLLPYIEEYGLKRAREEARRWRDDG